MPFEKGKSGNPNGRPPGARDKKKLEIEELAREHTPKAMKRLVELVENPKHPAHFNAIKEILDRGYGKAPQAHTLGDGDKGGLTVILHRDGNSPSK